MKSEWYKYGRYFFAAVIGVEQAAWSSFAKSGSKSLGCTHGVYDIKGYVGAASGRSAADVLIKSITVHD